MEICAVEFILKFILFICICILFLNLFCKFENFKQPIVLLNIKKKESTLCI